MRARRLELGPCGDELLAAARAFHADYERRLARKLGIRVQRVSVAPRCAVALVHHLVGTRAYGCLARRLLDRRGLVKARA
jgi:hypothetical protein